LTEALPPHLLEGRTVVVTGTSRGIGSAIVASLLQAGANVVAVSRSGTVPAVEAERILSVTCDVRADEAPEKIFASALSRFGRIDGLVNNAAIISFVNCWEQSDQDWDALFATNLTAPFRLSQWIARHWRDKGHAGTIVNICSVESEIVFHLQAGYASTKGGLLGLTRAMARELAPLGIRVVAIGPGIIDTGMTPPRPEDTDRIPMHRLGKTDEVGDVVVLALSDLARYITGTIIYVDGGYLTQ
jgi:NAD(P)-dependent dehydrogenase (short-subunit alcohol dehydrogenase family)